jgi:hypothetical protein
VILASTSCRRNLILLFSWEGAGFSSAPFRCCPILHKYWPGPPPDNLFCSDAKKNPGIRRESGKRAKRVIRASIAVAGDRQAITMARTNGSTRRRQPPPPPRRRLRMLVVSLLVQNPTSVSKETTTEPAPGVITRAHSRRIAAAAAALPEEILVWEILIRLPAKDILRYRAVCRSWRGLISAPDFLLAHHKCQPLLPIFTSIHGSSSLLKGYLSRLFKGGLPVLEFDDYEGFQLLASCDGLLQSWSPSLTANISSVIRPRVRALHSHASASPPHASPPCTYIARPASIASFT